MEAMSDAPTQVDGDGMSDDSPRFRTVEEYEARQESIRDELTSLDSEWQGRVMPEAQTGRWNELNSELEENSGIIAHIAARTQRLEELRDQPTAIEGARFNTNKRRGPSDIYDVWAVRQQARGPEDERRMLHDNATRAVEKARFPHPDIDDDVARAHIEKLMNRFSALDEDSSVGGPEGHVSSFARHILLTGRPEYRRAFGKTLMGRLCSPEEQRALSTTTTAGGYAVPFALDPTIIPTSNSSVNPYRAIARVETIAVSQWQGVTSAGVTATRRSEAATTVDGAPSTGQVTATPTRVDCFVPYSIEIGQDWGSLESEMATAIQDAKDDEEAVSYSTGSGSTPAAQGIVTAISGASAVTGATTATFAIADVFSVYNALPPRFKPRAQWVANEAVWNLIRQFATASGPSALVDSLQPGLGGQGVPRPGNVNATLLGRGANECSALSSSTATGAFNLILGDWRNFLIVDRIGMTVDLIPHLFATTMAPSGQRGLFAYWRNTSVCLTTNAFRINKVK